MAPLPDVPLFTKTGCPSLSASVRSGLFAPSATPKPLVERIAADAALKTPRLQRFLGEQASLASGRYPFASRSCVR